MTTIAKCCQPVPGDPVAGYITQGRGVTIHREDCGQVVHWRAENSPRLLQVSWGAQPETRYSVELLVRAYDRKRPDPGYFNGSVRPAETQVTDISSRLDETADEVTIRLKVRVKDYEQLSDLLSRLGNVSNVIEARRLTRRVTDSSWLVQRVEQCLQTQPGSFQRKILTHIFQPGQRNLVPEISHPGKGG